MTIRTDQEFEGMRQAGRAVAHALEMARNAVEPGINTLELDLICANALREFGARSAPQLEYNAPSWAFFSINDAVVHGLPSRVPLREGDLLKIDVTAELNGFMSDAAITVPVGQISGRSRQLVRCTEQALQRGLEVARAGNRIGQISHAVSNAVRKQGFRLARGLCGHGIGRSLHEAPDVPNEFDKRNNDWLEEGLVITIEPMVTAGTSQVFTDDDGWTIRTTDGSSAAHFEHTIMVTRNAPVILTAF
jgi:methionyl aminopeptidase